MTARTLSILAGSVVALGLLLLVLPHSPPIPPEASPPADNELPNPVSPTPALPTISGQRTVALAPRSDAVPAPNPPDADPVHDLLISALPDDAKGEELLARLPRLSGAAQAEAAQHMVNLLSDDGFLQVGSLLTNANTAEPTLSVLVADLMNRPDRVKLPLCLAIAQLPNHPQRDDARSVLQVTFDEDHAEDWRAWERAIEQRLQSEAADDDASATPPAPEPPP